MTDLSLWDTGDAELRAFYEAYVQEAKDYIAEQREAGAGMSAYGQDVMRLLKIFRAEMIERKLL